LSHPGLIEDPLPQAQRPERGGSAGPPYSKVVVASVVARIDEPACIGCTLCVEACPVDAIVGAAQLMHTVISAECIGCKLCLPPCPVDCITMVDTGRSLTRAERKLRAARAKLRIANQVARRKRERMERTAPCEGTAERRKRATVKRAMQRARQRLERRSRPSGKA
jgi:electron transport complex protein RnfB